MTNLNEFDTKKSHQAEVLESQRITPDDTAEVRSIRLKVSPENATFSDGQHIGVIAPGSSEFGHDKHFRLYTIANSPEKADDGSVELELCVRRCFYIDEFSGESTPGIASNFLCDLNAGDKIFITGPYGEAFNLPEDPYTNLLMIGSGTGIAPFRAFIQHIYDKNPDWQGKVMLFYGARTGTETLYHNDLQNDLDKYYDEKTFQAFEGLTKRPWMQQDGDGLGDVLEQNAEQIWELIQDSKTHVYLAGLPRVKDNFEESMQKVAGSRSRWYWMLEVMKEQGRWSELIYS